MGCGNSKRRRSSSPPLLIQRLGSAKMGKEHARHSLISDMDSFQPPASRKQSCLSVLDAPVRRLSLSIPDAGKTGDTISIRTTNVHMNSEDTVQQPVEDVVVSTTQMTASEASLSDSSIQNSVCETKSTDNGKPDQGIAAVAEAGTEEQKQTTEESTAGTKAQLTAKKHRLLNFTFLQRKISSTGIRSALEELSEARKADPDNKDLELLGLTLQLAQDALKYDPQQLPSQLLSRITAPTEGLLPLLEQCRAAQDLFLLSSQPLVLPPGGQLVHIIADHTSDVNSLTMTADGQYAVTCSEDGTVLVTDVIKGRKQRAISKIGESPVAVFLCCDDSLIVTTTRRHITAHRFETGEEAWKLEGSDLARYPPCLCFGGENQHTMVIFENTSVLLYEAATATKLDTLTVPQELDVKVRFDARDSQACARSGYAMALNADCTCLTSVHLTSKTVMSKMMPDPENQEEEDDLMIETLAMADGQAGQLCAIYTTAEDGDICFVDVATLNVSKVYKGYRSINPGTFHVSPDQRYLYFSKPFTGVSVWDLHNGGWCAILPEAKALTDVVTVDMKRFVTISNDRNVRVWDISQGTQPSALQFQDSTITRMENGKRVVVRDGQADDEEKTKVKVQDLLETGSPRYVVVTAEVNCAHSLQVFDVATSTVVRKMQLGLNVKVSRLQGCQVLLKMDRRLRVLDVDKMEVVTEFAGRVCHRSFTPIPIKEGKEILTTTKGGHHVKFYDTATGKVTAIIKQGETTSGHKVMMTLDDFMVSQDGSVGVAELEEEFLIFDLVKRSALRLLGESTLGTGYLNILTPYSALTDDGHFFLCLASKPMSGGGQASERREEFVLIYDIRSDTMVKNALDWHKGLEYTADEDKLCSVSELHLLDNDTLLVSHDDHILRVYDLQSGKLFHQLEGHRHIPTLSVRADNPVFLSFKANRGDSSVRLWRKSDFAPLASFTMETKLQTAMLLPGHSQDFLVVPEDSHTPVVFTVHGQNKQALPGHTTPPLASYPQLFEGIKLDSVLAPLPSPSDLAALDADDPDTDDDGCEEEDDDDDEDDDDSVE